jgi:hypothetical protein
MSDTGFPARERTRLSGCRRQLPAASTMLQRVVWKGSATWPPGRRWTISVFRHSRIGHDRPEATSLSDCINSVMLKLRFTAKHGKLRVDVTSTSVTLTSLFRVAAVRTVVHDN